MMAECCNFPGRTAVPRLPDAQHGSRRRELRPGYGIFLNATFGIGENTLRMLQVFVETNTAFLKGGTAWIGKCYYNRSDMQVLDFKYVVMHGTDGTSAGLNGVPMRPEKFSNGVFRKNTNKPQSATRHSFIYHDVPVNDATSRIK